MNKIDINYVNFLKSEMDKINKLDLSKVVFVENGGNIKIPDKIIDEFKFMGLNNTDFITSGYYKQ